MLQPGGEPDLALEPLGPEGGRELRMQHLERDRAVVPEVAGEKDRGHAPAPELALELVATAQPFLDLRPQIGHVGLSKEGCVIWPLQYPGGCTKPEARRGRVPRRREYGSFGRCAPSG